MEQISAVAPALPPKTRRAPPDSATVLSTSMKSAQVFEEYTYPGDVSAEESHGHVVKIRINPDNTTNNNNNQTNKTKSAVCAPCIISVNTPEMIRTGASMLDASSDRSSSAYFFYNCAVMSSGQVSPSDTLDSGTCSDLDGTPPPLPKKHNKNAGVSVTLIGGHKRASSLTSSADSDDNESNISCDSLNSGKISPLVDQKTELIPQTLLQDIRDRNSKATPIAPPDTSSVTTVKSYEERKEEDEIKPTNQLPDNFDTDMFYKFHLNEHLNEDLAPSKTSTVEDESFAGYRDILGDGAATIRSAKGTVRGVKNRVRAGIATFLQINSSAKNYKEKDAGKVVVYTTTMGILRETYQACMKVKQIMRTLLVKFEERDVFMSAEYQTEIRERMRCDHILVPQVFVDGQHIGDAETIERLNETGELRRILKPFKSMDACTTCKVCGGYRLLPCQVCNGSKKSVHRNHFTAEFVALKCMNCDEVGLVRCNAC